MNQNSENATDGDDNIRVDDGVNRARFLLLLPTLLLLQGDEELISTSSST